ncbi:hypothetical protein FB451DRAFT_323279 [Mycena latifolia]|nr:hypothetical protein FB451DRAFT_323279 [Mycena latifolia]
MTLALFCAAILASAIVNRFALFRESSVCACPPVDPKRQLARLSNSSETGKTSHASPTSSPQPSDTPARARSIPAQRTRTPRRSWPALALIGVAGMLPFIRVLMIAVRALHWPSAEMGNILPIAIMPSQRRAPDKPHETLQISTAGALSSWITPLVHTLLFIINDIKMSNTISWYRTSPCH